MAINLSQITGSESHKVCVRTTWCLYASLWVCRHYEAIKNPLGSKYFLKVQEVCPSSHTTALFYRKWGWLSHSWYVWRYVWQQICVFGCAFFSWKECWVLAWLIKQWHSLARDWGMRSNLSRNGLWWNRFGLIYRSAQSQPVILAPNEILITTSITPYLSENKQMILHASKRMVLS